MDIHLIIPCNRYIKGMHIKEPQEKEYTYQATQYNKGKCNLA